MGAIVREPTMSVLIDHGSGTIRCRECGSMLAEGQGMSRRIRRLDAALRHLVEAHGAVTADAVTLPGAMTTEVRAWVRNERPG